MNKEKSANSADDKETCTHITRFLQKNIAKNKDCIKKAC